MKVYFVTLSRSYDLTKDLLRVSANIFENSQNFSKMLGEARPIQ